MNSTIKTLKLSEVIIGERMRKSYRNIEELAASIHERGLIHPPTLDSNNTLIAGGRRMQALLMLEKSYPDKYAQVNFNIMQGEISPADLRILELTENTERQDMTWQERVMTIGEAHFLMQTEAKKKNSGWTQAQTGALFNVSKTTVQNMVVIYNALKAEDKEVMSCQNPLEALRVLVARVEDKARQELARRQALRARQAVAGLESQTEGGKLRATQGGQGVDKGGEMPRPEGRVENSGEIGDDSLEAFLNETATPSTTAPAVPFNIFDFYLLGDCRKVLPTLAAKADAILTDPPYAIDMDNLGNVERVKDNHGVADNLKLLPEFIKAAYDILKDNGVCVMWYDLEHHNFLIDHAKKVGFKPVAWPLVWCKNSPCANQAPQYNHTKCTEYVMVLRKGNYTLPQPVTCNFLVAKNERNASHPFFKPKVVWDWLIDLFTKQGDLVIDPFAGEGSSVLPLLLKKRAVIAIEEKEIHFNTAVTTIPKEYARECAMANVIDDFFQT